MQEVRRHFSVGITHLGYNLYWTGLKEKRKHRVEIRIRNSSDIVIVNILHQSIAVDIAVCGCKIWIISACVSTEKVLLLNKKTSIEG